MGLGIKNALGEGVVSRENIFVTTKIFNDDHGNNGTKKAIDLSLKLLALDYIDL